MADCVECGHVADELGYECNGCGRPVCWEHRRPGDHDCRPDDGVGATRTTAEGDPLASGGPSGAVGAAGDASTDRSGGAFEVDPAAEWDDPGGRAYPWWVYVLVAGLFVFPSLAAMVFALL
jgi:hypothetical protein